MRTITGWILAAALLPSTLAAAVAPLEEPAGGGIPPDPGPHDAAMPYVVITERRLEGPFMRLVQARTHAGLRAAVVTLEEIEADYPAGVDLAERIRMFLKDAYANRGTRWVLLGGDASVIPMRRARLWYSIVAPIIDLPTDQYYACLDGNWNADGDAHWGEGAGPHDPGDAPDLFPELCVGRAPVRSAAEAVDFVRRTLDYEKRLASPSPRSALLAAEVISGLIDGAQSTELLRPLMEGDPSRAILRLYENAAAWPGSHQETRATLLAALDDGSDLAMIVASGGPGVIVAGEEPADYVFSDDLLGLKNGSRLPIVYALSCYTTSPDASLSIGTALMQARRGGAAAVLGSTDNQFVFAGTQFSQRFFEEAMGSGAPIGAALARAITAIHVFNTGDFYRLTTQGYVIFGDPALRIDPADAAAALADLGRMGTMGGVLPAGAAGVASADVAAPFRTARVAASPGATLAIGGLDGSRESRAPARAAAEGPLAADAARATLDVLPAAVARTHAIVRFELPHDALGARYELAVFDLLGRRVRALAEGPVTPGRHEVAWDLRSEEGGATPSGVYFVLLRFGARALTRRIAVLE